METLPLQTIEKAAAVIKKVQNHLNSKPNKSAEILEILKKFNINIGPTSISVKKVINCLPTVFKKVSKQYTLVVDANSKCDCAEFIMIKYCSAKKCIYKHPNNIKQNVNPATAVTTSSNNTTANISINGSINPKNDKRYQYVDTLENLKEASDQIMKHKSIAVDCEGVNLGKDGKICLIQVATDVGDVYLLDILRLVRVHGEDCVSIQLMKFLQNQGIEKIMHDPRKDNEALYHQLGIEIDPITDTQFLYGILELITHCDVKSRISLSILFDKYKLGDVSRKQRTQKMMQEDSNIWEKRPLDPDLLEYAAADVIYLHQLRKLIVSDTEKKVKEMQQRNAKSLLPNQENKPKEQTYASVAAIPQDRDLYLTFDNKEPVYTAPSLEERETDITNQPIKNKIIVEDHEVHSILSVFPRKTAENIFDALNDKMDSLLTEIIVDKGAPISLRFSDDSEVTINRNEVVDDIHPYVDQLLNNTNNTFSDDNRIGIQGSLHRISAIKNKKDEIVGLTYRIGRHIDNSTDMITDIIDKIATKSKDGTFVEPQSLLILGPPGVGKTTLLREISKVLADNYSQRVMIVDTSNEIGGDGDIPHRCIGKARRMQVRYREKQHNTMIEAIQNHNPTVLIIDEIGTSKEVKAAKTISQRGCALIGTAHGYTIDSLLKNPELIPLLGGLQSVILGDKEAKKKDKDGINNKVKLERAGSPSFSIIIEIKDKNTIHIHSNVSNTVDSKLSQSPYSIEKRWSIYDSNGKKIMFARFQQENSLVKIDKNWLDTDKLK